MLFDTVRTGAETAVSSNTEMAVPSNSEMEYRNGRTIYNGHDDNHMYLHIM